MGINEVYRRHQFLCENTPFLLCCIFIYGLLQETFLYLDKKPSRESTVCLLGPCPRHNVLEIHAPNASYSVYILNGRHH